MRGGLGQQLPNGDAAAPTFLLGGLGRTDIVAHRVHLGCVKDLLFGDKQSEPNDNETPLLQKTIIL